MQTIFVTGISTEVGKTIASAILVEAFCADYWKPIQSGDLENSDTMKVQRLVTNETSRFFPNAYALQTPASPHWSASLENTEIRLENIQRPTTKNTLVIEGAGGFLVPLNAHNTIADLVAPSDKIVLISRHYLGSINHTMLTIEAILRRNLTLSGIIFSGNEHTSTESWIANATQIPILGRIEEEAHFSPEIIRKYALKMKNNLQKIVEI